MSTAPAGRAKDHVIEATPSARGIDPIGVSVAVGIEYALAVHVAPVTAAIVAVGLVLRWALSRGSPTRRASREVALASVAVGLGCVAAVDWTEIETPPPRTQHGLSTDGAIAWRVESRRSEDVGSSLRVTRHPLARGARADVFIVHGYESSFGPYGPDRWLVGNGGGLTILDPRSGSTISGPRCQAACELGTGLVAIVGDVAPESDRLSVWDPRSATAEALEARAERRALPWQQRATSVIVGSPSSRFVGCVTTDIDAEFERTESLDAWDLTEGRRIYSRRTGRVLGFALSDAAMAVIEQQENATRLRAVALPSGMETDELEVPAQASRVAVARDGRQFAVAANAVVCHRDAGGRWTAVPTAADVADLIFTPDDRELRYVLVDGTAWRWDFAAGRRPARLAVMPPIEVDRWGWRALARRVPVQWLIGAGVLYALLVGRILDRRRADGRPGGVPPSVDYWVGVIVAGAAITMVSPDRGELRPLTGIVGTTAIIWIHATLGWAALGGRFPRGFWPVSILTAGALSLWIGAVWGWI